MVRPPTAVTDVVLRVRHIIKVDTSAVVFDSRKVQPCKARFLGASCIGVVRQVAFFLRNARVEIVHRTGRCHIRKELWRPLVVPACGRYGVSPVEPKAKFRLIVVEIIAALGSKIVFALKVGEVYAVFLSNLPVHFSIHVIEIVRWADCRFRILCVCCIDKRACQYIEVRPSSADHKRCFVLNERPFECHF